MKNVSPEEWLAIERTLAKRSFAAFVKMAWHILEPSNKYIPNWHIDAICEHMAAVTSGEIKRLLINVPPGMSKSLIVNVFHPCWEWGPCGMPAMRYIAAAHEQKLAIRDNLKMRRLVESAWYQERWPTPFTKDQNSKIKFESQATGFRQASAISSMTGNRGDRIILDDPHSVQASLSDVQREATLQLFTETVPTRLNNPKESAIIVVMQRLHEDDISGYIIDQNLGYEHLMLPMEYEPERKCFTSIGFEDPRTEEGELLFPERFPLSVVEADKKVMGSLAVAGQFQQRPAPRSGGFFDWQNLVVVNTLPKFGRVVRYWDKAGTQDGGCYTAGVKIGMSEDEREFYVLDVVRGQWNAPKRERIIKETAIADGKGVDIFVEQEPGSGGKESAQGTVANLRGYTCRADCPSGDKAVRAEPYSVQVEAGNVQLLYGDWNRAFIDEHKTFPRGKYKDQIDAASAAFNKLAIDKPRQVRVAIVGGYGSSSPSFYSSARFAEPQPRPLAPAYLRKEKEAHHRRIAGDGWEAPYREELRLLGFSSDPDESEAA